MDDEYVAMRKRAVDIEAMFRQMLDKRNHRVARIIWDEFTALIIDIRETKHPRTIEQRIQRIQIHLVSARKSGEHIMRIDENVYLHDHCERFRRDLRKMKQYQ